MRDLGAAAGALIRPLPSSGTAERSLAINMLTNPGGALMQRRSNAASNRRTELDDSSR